MEAEPVVEAVAGELREVLDRLRRVVVERARRDRAVVGVQRRLGHDVKPIREIRAVVRAASADASVRWAMLETRSVRFPRAHGPHRRSGDRDRGVGAAPGRLITRHVLTWILVALFLAIALTPAVDWLQRKGIQRRGLRGRADLVSRSRASSRDRLRSFIPHARRPGERASRRKVPDYIDDLTKGRGRLGFLETKYHIVERVREAVEDGRREQGVRALRHRDLDHEERPDAGRRDDHDRRADVLHAARGADVDGALLRPSRRRRSRGRAGDLSGRHRRNGRRLRDRQPLDQPDRGRDVRRSCSGSWACRSPSRSGCSSGSSISIPLAGATIAAIIVSTVAFLALDPRPGIVVDRLLHRLPAAREPPAAAARLRAHRPALAARRSSSPS